MKVEKLLRYHTSLASHYDRMEALLERDDEALFRYAPEVSGWSVANQLHHVATATGLMLTGITRIARKAEPASPDGSITALGRGLLLAKRFPRGKAKAPASTQPPETVSREELTDALQKSRRVYDMLPDMLGKAAESGWKVRHPYFGMLNAAEWLKLAQVHADHHFLIIDDIDRAG